MKRKVVMRWHQNANFIEYQLFESDGVLGIFWKKIDVVIDPKMAEKWLRFCSNWCVK